MSNEDGQEPKRRGRPPKSEADRKSDNFKFRARGAIREQLEESAAKNRRSLSEEIEARIGQSFNYDDIYNAVDDSFNRNMRLLFGGKDHAIIMIELAKYLQRSFEAADAQVSSNLEWFSNEIKQQIVEETFGQLARRAIKAAAKRERSDANEKKEKAERSSNGIS